MKKRKTNKVSNKHPNKPSSLNKLLVGIIIFEILYFGFRFLNNYIYQQKQGNISVNTTIQCLQEGKRYFIDEAVLNPQMCDLEVNNEQDFKKLAQVTSRLMHVQTIYFRKTPNTQIPKEIGQLANLRVLNFHHTFSTSLPPEIGELNNLTNLNLNQADIKNIPAEIGNLSNLENLSITFNAEKIELPKEITGLKKLKVLAVNNNPGLVLPVNLNTLESLEELDISANNLNKVPEDLYNLTNLKILNISKNSFHTKDTELLNSKLSNTTIVF